MICMEWLIFEVFFEMLWGLDRCIFVLIGSKYYSMEVCDYIGYVGCGRSCKRVMN